MLSVPPAPPTYSPYHYADLVFHGELEPSTTSCIEPKKKKKSAIEYFFPDLKIK